MWRYLWLLTVFLDFGFGSADRSYYGLKHVRVTPDTCAVIIGRNLRKTETDLRREKVSAPCFDGPHVFGVTNTSDKLFVWMCYVESDSVLKCVEYNEYGFIKNVRHSSLAGCGFANFQNVSISSEKTVTLYSDSSICHCSEHGCATLGPRNGACPVEKVHNCDCNTTVRAYRASACRRSGDGILYFNKENKYWEYNYWPLYDYFFEDSTVNVPESQQFVLFRYMVKDGICTIAVSYAFEAIPFYYFDTGKMDDGLFVPTCFDEDVKLAVAKYEILTNSTGAMACFLSSAGLLQCGTFSFSYFVLGVNADLDMSLCNYTTSDYYLSVLDFIANESKLHVQLCLTEFNEEGQLQCCFYEVAVLWKYWSTSIQNETAAYVEEGLLVTPTAFRGNGTETRISGSFDNATSFVIYTTKWDAFARVSDLNGVMFHRLYGFAYVKKRNYCLLEYRQPTHLIHDKIIPCLPENELKLFHLTNLDGYNFVEVCHHSKKNETIICSDHYTNSTFFYSLSGCNLYSDEAEIYLYGHGKSLHIGDQYTSCIIERTEPGKYSLSAESIVVESDQLVKFKMMDAIYGKKVTLMTGVLKQTKATGFDLVSGTTTLKTASPRAGVCTYYYDKDDSDFYAISEGFEYTVFLTRFGNPLYIPGREKRYNCEPRITASPVYVILVIDIILVAAFVTVIVFEIRGYRTMMYKKIREELIELKYQSFDGRYF